MWTRVVSPSFICDQLAVGNDRSNNQSGMLLLSIGLGTTVDRWPGVADGYDEKRAGASSTCQAPAAAAAAAAAEQLLHMIIINSVAAAASIFFLVVSEYV